MDFDQLLIHFFGTSDLATLPEPDMLAGVEQMRLQFGLEKDSGRRFALWCLLYMLGAAPDIDAFKDPADQEAARDFMDMADAEDEDED